MGYERDEAMRQQEATEAMIRMREPRRPSDGPFMPCRGTNERNSFTPDNGTVVYDGPLRNTLCSLIRREHSDRPNLLIGYVRLETMGTGYLVTYRLDNAFPEDLKHGDEYRVAFCHEDGIIWDRSTRFVDPGAATADL